MALSGQLKNIYGYPYNFEKKFKDAGYDLDHFATLDDLANSDFIRENFPALAIGIIYRYDINRPVPRKEIDDFVKIWRQIPDFKFDIVGDYRRGNTYDFKITMVTTATRYELRQYLKDNYIPGSEFIDTDISDGILTEIPEYLIKLKFDSTVRRLYIHTVDPEFYGTMLLKQTDMKTVKNGMEIDMYEQFLQKLGYELIGWEGIFDTTSNKYLKADFPTELSVFEYFNIEYIPPEQRLLPRTIHIKSFSAPRHFSEVKLGQFYLLSDIVRANVGNNTSHVAATIAKSLVRLASTRIFSNPYQSVMEPISNAIDAYSQTKTIGKFGLGFYSIFFWLVQDTYDRCYIDMCSRTVDEYWSSRFRHIDELMVEFLEPVTSDLYYPEGKTGTFLKITYLPKDDLSKFVEQLQRFFITDVQILIYYNDESVLYASNRSSGRSEIIVMIDLEHGAVDTFDLYIKDYAGGITTVVLLKSLLIPTSSTKGIVSIPNNMPTSSSISTNTVSTHSAVSTRLGQISENPGLYFIVDGVAVVHIKFDMSKIGYFIYFSGVSVPVSRDDILLDASTLNLLEQAFLELANKCIESGNILDDYFRHLTVYASYTDQLGVTKIIQNVRQYVLDRTDIILLPSRQIVELMREGKYGNVNYLSDINIVESRNKLDKLFDTILGPEAGRNVFRNIRFIHLLGSFLPTDAGIPGYIFVDNPFVEASTFINSYQGALLRKIDDPVTEINIEYLYADLNKTTFQVYEFPHSIQFPHSILIYNNKFFGRESFPAMSPDNIYPFYGQKSIYVPSINSTIMYQITSRLYYSEIRLLYSTIESWILSLSEKIIVNVTEPGRFSSNSQNIQKLIFVADSSIPIKTSIINAIFEHCLISIYTFRINDNKDGIRTKEYIVSLCQFFNHIKIEIGQGVIKNFWFGRVTPHGWIKKVEITTHRKKVDSKNREDIKSFDLDFDLDLFDTITYHDIVDRYRKIQQDGFFQSLKRVLDDKLYLREDMFLLDSRYFIDVGLNNLHYMLDQAYEDRVDLGRFIEVLLTHSDAGLEINMICDIIFTFVEQNSPSNDQLLNMLRQQIADGSIVDIIVVELRKRFPFTFFTQYLSEPPTPENIKWITNTVYVPMSKALETHLTLQMKNEKCEFVEPIQPNDMIGQLSLQKLISYIFNHDDIEVNSLDDLANFISQVNQWSMDDSAVKLQMVEIAVNTGTTKPFIDSVSTELIQNSIDAFRKAQQKQFRGDGMIYINFCTSASRFQLLESDFIGIEESALLPLMIPFYSSKIAAKAEQTGEMGSGIFNIYRQPWSEKVWIQSKKFLIQTDIVKEAGLVTDIIYNIHQKHTSSWMTSFSIISPPLSDELLTQVSLDMHIYAQTYFPAIQTPIFLNDERMNNPQDLVKISSYDGGSIYMFKKGVQQSIVMTNGVPFSPLMSFLEQFYGPITNSLLATNLVVDLDKNIYTPTQGRNRLNIFDNDGENPLREFLTVSLTAATITKLTTVDDVLFERYMPGTTSAISLDQFSTYGLDFSIFNKQSGTTCFYVTLFSRSDSIISRPNLIISYGSIWFNIISSYQKSGSVISLMKTHQYVSDFLQDRRLTSAYQHSDFSVIVNRWLINKLPAVVRNIIVDKSIQAMVSVTTSSSSGEKVKPEEILLGIFQRFVDEYYNIARDSNIVNLDFSRTPRVFFGDTGSDALAVYMPLQHQIVVNLAKLEEIAKPIVLVNEWFTYLQMQREDRATDARYHLSISKINKYLGNTFPGATIPHEILHAANHTSHQSAHDPISFEMDGTIYTDTPFEETCHILYNTMLAQGLVERLKR